MGPALRVPRVRMVPLVLLVRMVRMDPADTAGEVLSKLLTVDGAASLLDADTLDGFDSTSFMHGERFFASGAGVDINRTLPSFGYLFLFCQLGSATMQYQNASGGDVTLFTDRASTHDVQASTVPHGDAPIILNMSSAVADHFTVRVASGSRSVTWDAWVTADGSTCTFDLVEVDQP